ncbi:MAG: FAD-dependent oxidoreductase [Sphingomonas sp.]|nr:FAD-dependent oxidoreductase [Sphingomonas sp.]MDX3884524.1 FAD-dependent oxidoreductase [Sphingomonas sp.]
MKRLIAQADSRIAPARRQVLAAGTAGLAALALPGCATLPAARPHGAGRRGCLPRVNVAPDRVIRTVAGLRPYRPSGFVVRAEALGAKRLVHNYGHGGGGITLSWGSSRLAVDLALPGQQGGVAVIGAGVMGLTTARLVQEAGFPVTIYTAKLPPETTSNIAGGQWFPSSVVDGDRLTPAFSAQLVAAARYAYRRYQILAGEEYGVRWMRNYSMSNRLLTPGPIDTLLMDLFPEAKEVAAGDHPFPYPNVRQFDGMIVDPGRFLRALERDIRIAGGRIVIRPFHSVDDIAALPEATVINCTGLGSRALFGDAELEPVRGQLAVLLPQPEVDYALSAPGGLYMFSRADGVILGGTHEHGVELAEPEPETIARIVEGHRKLFAGFRCG